MNRTKGTKRTHPKEANGTWTKVNKVHALFTSISSFGSSLFFIYWIKTKEKGVRSLTLFPLVFYSIKEQQRTSVKSKNKRKQMSACFALFTCFFSLCWKWSVKKGRGAHSTCPLLSSFHFIFNTTLHLHFLFSQLIFNGVKRKREINWGEKRDEWFVLVLLLNSRLHCN